TAVRAIAPVAGIPPKKPAAADARPWPTSSRSASKGPVREIEAATRAESKDSIAASAATATAGPASALIISRFNSGTVGAGRLAGSCPIWASGASTTTASTVTTTIARKDPGNRGAKREQSTMIPATTTTAVIGTHACGQEAAATAWPAAMTALV